MRDRRDRGETLLEVIITMTVIAISVTALLTSLMTVASAAKSHRDYVRLDTVVRSYAEATKDAASACTDPGTYQVAFAPPSGFTVSSDSTGVCPPVTATQLVTLAVTDPNGRTRTLQIRVRTP